MAVIRSLADTKANRRRLALFVAVVALPVIALGFLAIRAFQSEQLREQVQQQERRQQTLRLLESDLANWILSSQALSPRQHRFEIAEDVIRFPSLNVFVAAGWEDTHAGSLSGAERSRLSQAEIAEVRGSRSEAWATYQNLLTQVPGLAPAARLGLLRLSLSNGNTSQALLWTEEIKTRDLEAMTESHVPIWEGVAQLLATDEHMRGRSETLDFHQSMLDELEGGRWNLNAAKWVLYARESAEALRSAPDESTVDLVRTSLATANLLQACSESAPQILALRRYLEGESSRAFAAEYFERFPGVVVLVPGKDKPEGSILEPEHLVREAEMRLAALTTAENYTGKVGISPGKQPETNRLPLFPFLGISFVEKYQGGLSVHLSRYFILYATAALFLVTAVGLIFTVKAVWREVEVSRMKTDFVSSVSHEFRTPLSSIDAVLERIESGKVGDPDMLKRYCRLSRQEVQRLARMVSDLLDFERLEKGRPESSFENLDLNLAVAEVIESFRNLGFGSRLSKIQAAEEGPLTIRADRNAVLQGIHNLIDNALKYAPDPTQVTVRTGLRGTNPCVEVTDHGPGIADEERGMVFEPFYRSPNLAAPGIKGTGIGLALVKRIMEAHGGEVALESHAGKGSTFALIFPGSGA